MLGGRRAFYLVQPDGPERPALAQLRRWLLTQAGR